MTSQHTHASGRNDAESTINSWEILDDMVEASLCGICWKLLDKMYTATCGHSYCMKCAEELLSGEAHNRLKPVGYGTCPMCKGSITSPTRFSAGVKKPALKHSVMIRHNFEHLRTWANWRKGQDDRAREAGESIGQTRCNWRLNGWEIDVEDVTIEDVDEDVDEDIDEDGDGDVDEDVDGDVDEDVDDVDEDDSDDATQAFSQESFEERLRQMQQRPQSPPTEYSPPSLARHNTIMIGRTAAAVYPSAAGRPVRPARRNILRSALGPQARLAILREARRRENR